MSVLPKTVSLALNVTDEDVAGQRIINQIPSATPRPSYVQLSRNNSIPISPEPLFTPGSTFNTEPSQTYRILPIIAGVLIPFLVLLSIPSFTNHWYVRVTGGDVQSSPNPFLLNVAVSLSMACGVLANFCLVLRFSERRVRTMTLLCIILLSVNGSCVFPESLF